MNANQNTYHVASAKKIRIYTLCALGLIVLLSLLDRFVLREFDLVIIENYSSIALTTWAVQATMSALTIAFLTICSNRLKDTHYGFTLEELLCIKTDSLTRLNFYETLIIVVALNALSLPAILINSLMMVCVICCISMYLTIVIVYESLQLAMSDEYIHRFAKEYVYRVLDLVKNTRVEQDEMGLPLYTDRQREYLHALTKLRLSLLSKAAQGNIPNASEDEDLVFFDDALKRFAPEHKLRGNTLECMSRLINDAVLNNNSNLAYSAYTYLPSDAIDHILEAIWLLSHHYYTGAISRREFDMVYNSLFNGRPISNRCIFIFMAEVIINADIDMLNTLLPKIDYSLTSDNSDYLIYAAFAYIYYLSFYEPSYIKTYGEAKHKLLGEAYSNLNYSIKDRRPQFSLIQLLSDCFTNDAEEKAHGYFQYFRNHTRISNDSKGLNFLPNDDIIIEYCIFYLYSHFSEYSEKENELLRRLPPSSAIVNIHKRFFSNTGEIKPNKSRDYERFAVWIQLSDRHQRNSILFESTSDNNGLLGFLRILLKDKILEETIIARESLPKYRDAILKQCQLLQRKYQKSENYTALDADNTTLARYETIRTLHVIGTLEHQISRLSEMNEHVLLVPFKKNEDKLIRRALGNANIIKNLSDVLTEQQHVLISCDSCYTQKISEHYMFKNIDANLKKQLNQLDAHVQCVDEDKIENQSFFIYYDSSLYKPAFSVRIEIQEYLTDDEIDYYLRQRHKHDEGYCIDENGDYRTKDSLIEPIRITCTREEEEKWLKNKYFCINHHVTYTVAQEPFGLVVSLDDPNDGTTQ